MHKGPVRSVLPSANKKQRVITLLTKLNDRDTYQKATAELHELVNDGSWMDADSLVVLCNQLCIPSPGQKVLARKECARVLGMLASRQCPARSTAVAPAILSKIILQLRRYMQDTDSSVRDAASEAAAQVARGLWECGGVMVSTGGDAHQCGSANPVGRMLLECLAEGKRELQAAACGALGQAAPYLGKVDAPMVKEVVKRLNSPSFQAHTALLGAVGHTDPTTGTPLGLIQCGGSVFHHFLPQLFGHSGGSATGTTQPQSPSTGLCACLGSKDWSTRKAASDCLHALFLVLGPLCEPEGVWDASDPRSLTARCARMLDGARFDKVKEVRDSAREAVALLEALRDYCTTGGIGPTVGWQEHARSALASRGLAAPEHPAPHPPRPKSGLPARPSVRVGAEPPISRSSPKISPPTSPSSNRPPSRPGFLSRNNTALAARFKEAHGDVDVIVESKRKPRGSAGAESQPASPTHHSYTRSLSDMPHMGSPTASTAASSGGGGGAPAAADTHQHPSMQRARTMDSAPNSAPLPDAEQLGAEGSFAWDTPQASIQSRDSDTGGSSYHLDATLSQNSLGRGATSNDGTQAAEGEGVQVHAVVSEGGGAAPMPAGDNTDAGYAVMSFPPEQQQQQQQPKDLEGDKQHRQYQNQQQQQQQRKGLYGESLEHLQLDQPLAGSQQQQHSHEPHHHQQPEQSHEQHHMPFPHTHTQEPALPLPPKPQPPHHHHDHNTTTGTAKPQASHTQPQPHTHAHAPPPQDEDASVLDATLATLPHQAHGKGHSQAHSHPAPADAAADGSGERGGDSEEKEAGHAGADGAAAVQGPSAVVGGSGDVGADGDVYVNAVQRSSGKGEEHGGHERAPKGGAQHTMVDGGGGGGGGGEHDATDGGGPGSEADRGGVVGSKTDGVGERGGDANGGLMVTVTREEWEGLQQRVREAEGESARLARALSELQASSDRAVAELQSHVARLEAQQAQQQRSHSPSAASAWVQPSSPKRQAAVALQGACSADVNDMYAEALQHGRGPAHLLDLMKYTGIAWSDLQPQVAHQLLAAFATCAQYPDVLPKAMPWLWRLADEQQTPSHLQPSLLPADTREHVLEGLAQASSSLQCSHPSVSERAEHEGSAAAPDSAQPLGSQHHS